MQIRRPLHALLALALLGSCKGAEPAASDGSTPAEPAPVASPTEPAPASATEAEAEPPVSPEPELEAEVEVEPPPPPPSTPQPIPEGEVITVNTITAFPELPDAWQEFELPEGVYGRKFTKLQRGFLMQNYDRLFAFDDSGTVVQIELPGWTDDTELLGAWPGDLWTFERQRGSSPKLRIMHLVERSRWEPELVNGEEWLGAGKQEIRKSTGPGLLVRRKVTGVSRTFERHGSSWPALKVPKVDGKLIELLEIPRGELHAVVDLGEHHFAIETPGGRLMLPPCDLELADPQLDADPRFLVDQQHGWAPDYLAVTAHYGLLSRRRGFLLFHDASGWIAETSDDFPSAAQLFVAADGTVWFFDSDSEEIPKGDDFERLRHIYRRSPDGSWVLTKVSSMVYLSAALSEDGTRLWVTRDDGGISTISALSS